MKNAAELSAVATATTLPLILGSIPSELENTDLSAYRVRIYLQGHLPIMAAVQSIYETMKALRGGTPPAEIKNIASNSLMKTLTRSAQYDEATHNYLCVE